MEDLQRILRQLDKSPSDFGLFAALEQQLTVEFSNNTVLGQWFQDQVEPPASSNLQTTLGAVMKRLLIPKSTAVELLQIS